MPSSTQRITTLYRFILFYYFKIYIFRKSWIATTSMLDLTYPPNLKNLPKVYLEIFYAWQVIEKKNG